MTDYMNNLIKHYFPSLVFLGLFFMISCTDDPEMIRSRTVSGLHQTSRIPGFPLEQEEQQKTRIRQPLS